MFYLAGELSMPKCFANESIFNTYKHHFLIEMSPGTVTVFMTVF